MHKYILKAFNSLKICFEFVKILVLFSIISLLLFWVENLISADWAWLNFIRPLLEAFVSVGAMVSDKEIYLFDAKFEYKYLIALIIFLVIYYIDYLIVLFIGKLEDFYCEGRKVVHKMQENHLNNSLQQQQDNEQKKIKKYQIFVSTKIKKKYSHQEQFVNHGEQNVIMNKFLISNTGVNPQRYQEGFLYCFEDFENIDNILISFFKLIKSKAPLDYKICVQIVDGDSEKVAKQLNDLISLEFVNKIVILSDTVWRYRHNSFHRFGTSQLGLFQKEGGTYEVHEFIEI